MRLCLLATILSTPKWTDEVGLALSGVLALVGIVGIIVAICTLKIIERQTKATEMAANAAKASADALIVSERAWVMVDLDRVPGVGLLLEARSSEGNTAVCVRARCICGNLGKTPAKVGEKRIGLFVTTPDKPLPEEPNLEIAIFDTEPHYLQPAQPFYRDTTVYGDGEWAVGNMVVVYGVVKYRHIFSDREVQTTFGYRVTEDFQLERLPDTYPKYNRNT